MHAPMQSPPNNEQPARVLISRQEVMHMLGISSTTLHRVRTTDSNFPKPIKDGPHRQAHCYFVKAEVEAWIKSKGDRRAAA